jgi:acyl-coenzyme A thioesterase PaaI-like protein
MRAIRVVDASVSSGQGDKEATAIFELDVVPELCNPMDRLHGGAMALLGKVDMGQTSCPC